MIDKTGPAKGLRFVKIPSTLKNYSKLNKIFEHSQFIDSEVFIDEVEENIRQHCETLDVVEGFDIFTETFSSFSFAAPIILNKLEDEFGSKHKVVYAIWDCNPSDNLLHTYQLFLNSLVSVETLSHTNTLLLPISHYKHIGKPTRCDVHSFEPWSEFDHRLDFQDVYQRSRLFGYLIRSFSSAACGKLSKMSAVVDAVRSSVWGSAGCMAGLSHLLFAPMNNESHCFKTLNEFYALAGSRDFDCLSPGLSHPQPRTDEVTYQLVTLNDHPELNEVLLEKEISRYHWRDSLSRAFHPDCFTKQTMLELYLQYKFPSTLSETACFNHRFMEAKTPNHSLYFPSLTSVFTGRGQVECLRKYMAHMQDTPISMLKHLNLRNFDFSSDSIENYLNEYNLLCERVDPVAMAMLE